MNIPLERHLSKFTTVESLRTVVLSPREENTIFYGGLLVNGSVSSACCLHKVRFDFVKKKKKETKGTNGSSPEDAVKKEEEDEDDVVWTKLAVFRGHCGGYIRQLHTVRAANFIVTCGYDKTARVFTDVNDADVKAPPGTVVVVDDDNGTAAATTAGDDSRLLRTHRFAEIAWACAVHPRGDKYIIGLYESQMILFSSETHMQQAAVKLVGQVNTLAWSPDGLHLLVCVGNTVNVFSDDDKLTLMRTVKMAERFDRHSHLVSVHCACWQHDSRLIAVSVTACTSMQDYTGKHFFEFFNADLSDADVGAVPGAHSFSSSGTIWDAAGKMHFLSSFQQEDSFDFIAYAFVPQVGRYERLRICDGVTGFFHRDEKLMLFWADTAIILQRTEKI